MLGKKDRIVSIATKKDLVKFIVIRNVKLLKCLCFNVKRLRNVGLER